MEVDSKNKLFWKTGRNVVHIDSLPADRFACNNVASGPWPVPFVTLENISYVWYSSSPLHRKKGHSVPACLFPTPLYTTGEAPESGITFVEFIPLFAPLPPRTFPEADLFRHSWPETYRHSLWFWASGKCGVKALHVNAVLITDTLQVTLFGGKN